MTRLHEKLCRQILQTAKSKFKKHREKSNLNSDLRKSNCIKSIRLQVNLRRGRINLTKEVIFRKEECHMLRHSLNLHHDNRATSKYITHVHDCVEVR